MPIAKTPLNTRNKTTSLMSNFKLAKKLIPSKKAWKSFTNTLHLKLNKLKIISQSIKKTTRRVVSLPPIRPLLPRKLRAITCRSSPNCHNIYHYHHHHQFHKSHAAIYLDKLFPESGSTKADHLKSIGEPINHRAKEMATSSNRASMVEAETIFTGSRVSEIKARALVTPFNSKNQLPNVAAMGAKVVDIEKALLMKSEEVEKITYSVADAWKATLLPQIRGVDERAEEFISKFREEMKLQREQSILDFQEMLARSA